MMNVNDVVQRYRLQLRQIWNGCFWVDPQLRDWESVYAFRKLKLPLFTAIVAHPLGLENVERVFRSGFRVVPSIPRGFSYLHVNRSKPSSSSSGIWEPLSGEFRAEDVQFTLVDFFDWMPLGYIDLQYYVVLVEGFRDHEDLVGQHALIEVNFADVVWIEP
jgi:hypothetical protein